MTNASRLLCGLSALFAVLGLACGSDSTTSDNGKAAPPFKPPPPGVSALSYSPKPFSTDETEMHVHFTTTGPAGPDRHYKVWLFTGKSHRDPYCYPEFESDEVVQGRAGKTHSVTLELEAHDGGHACFGSAQLVVWTQENDYGSLLRRRVMRKLSFWILPSPSSDESTR